MKRSQIEEWLTFLQDISSEEIRVGIANRLSDAGVSNTEADKILSDLSSYRCYKPCRNGTGTNTGDQ
jgi:hypothetical protein